MGQAGTTTRWFGQADELAAWEHGARAPGSRCRWRSWERTNRLRHFLSPQLAALVLDQESLLESHRRDIVVVFCDLRNFTTFAETSEPEEVMVSWPTTTALSAVWCTAHEGTLERVHR